MIWKCHQKEDDMIKAPYKRGDMWLLISLKFETHIILITTRY